MILRYGPLPPDCGRAVQRVRLTHSICKILHLLWLTGQTNSPPSLRSTYAVLRWQRRTVEKDQTIDSRQ